MGKNIDFVTKVHTATKRNYLERVTSHDKAKCAELAIQWDKDYWDGDRSTGYGGMRYDGRWKATAEAMVKHYDLKPGARILDIGCGKGFLMYDFTQVLPGCEVHGLDISEYGIANAKEEVRPFIKHGHAKKLPFPDKHFDLVVSLNTFHNLFIFDLWSALQEMERVGKRDKYLVVEAYRNEQEKVNLMYWQLTCRAFHTPQEWEWLYNQTGYSGDYGFIYFE